MLDGLSIRRRAEAVVGGDAVAAADALKPLNDIMQVLKPALLTVQWDPCVLSTDTRATLGAGSTVH